MSGYIKAFLFFGFFLACIIYSAAIQIPWSNKETIQAAIVGNLILGAFTFGGAALVILAAIIQAAAMDRQLKNSDKKENKKLLHRYIGWFEVMINTYSGQYAVNRARAYNLRVWLQNNPALLNVPDIGKWIEGFVPQRPIADPQVYDLRALIPLTLTIYVSQGSNAIADIEQTLINIRLRFESRAAAIPHPNPEVMGWDDDIIEQMRHLDLMYAQLMTSYETGIPQAKIHLKNKIQEAAAHAVI